MIHVPNILLKKIIVPKDSTYLPWFSSKYGGPRSTELRDRGFSAVKFFVDTHGMNKDIELTSWEGGLRTFWGVELFWEVGLGWNLKSEHFRAILRYSKIFKKFRRQKIYFFRVQIFFAHFFRKINPKIFRNLKKYWNFSK